MISSAHRLSRATVLALALVAAPAAHPCFAAPVPDDPPVAGGAATTEAAPQPAGLFAPRVPPAPQTTTSGTPKGRNASSPSMADRFKTSERNAPDRDDRTLINLGNKHFNGIFGGLGEAGGISVGLQATTADSIPGVELSVDAIGSFKGYRQFEGEAYFPHVGGENTHADVDFRYRRRTKDNFFGLGPKVGGVDVTGITPATGLGFPFAYQSEDYETNYDVEDRQTSVSLFHDFSDEFQAGIYGAYNSTGVREADAETPIGDIFNPTLAGVCYSLIGPGGTVSDCIVRLPLPGLFTGSRTLTEGVYAEYDGRNNDDGLTKGFYAYARFANHDGRGRNDVDPDSLLPALVDPNLPPGFPFGTFANPVRDFNDFGWTQATFDVRGYVPLGGDKTSLALRYFTDLNDPKGGSSIPFYRLARLGGRTTLRGFDSFRFYGNNSILFQGELRQTVYDFDDDSKYGEGVDVIVLGDTGQVWGIGVDRGLAPNAAYNKLTADNFEADYGVGLQYRYNRQFTVRVDFGHSNETSKVWFSFNRVF